MAQCVNVCEIRMWLNGWREGIEQRARSQPEKASEPSLQVSRGAATPRACMHEKGLEQRGIVSHLQTLLSRAGWTFWKPWSSRRSRCLRWIQHGRCFKGCLWVQHNSLQPLVCEYLAIQLWLPVLSRPVLACTAGQMCQSQALPAAAIAAKLLLDRDQTEEA